MSLLGWVRDIVLFIVGSAIVAMEVTQILLNAQSVDGTVRKHAEESLKQFQEQNFPTFLLSLSSELANNDKPVDSRKLAGLILKNVLDAKEQHRKNELVQRWLSLDVAVKAQVKACLLQTLSSPVPDARSTASQANFSNDMERDYIMRVVVCEATMCLELKIRQAAFECLVAISSTYYDKLASYMQDIFSITAKAVREDEEPVALQAIEFWSSICDEEIDILDEYGGDFTADSDIPCYYFIKQALPALIPMLLETLLKQEEDQDQDEGAWNLAMAGGTCLGEHKQTRLEAERAATYAFGSILEGPSPEKLIPLVNVALNFMLSALMKDPNNHVKDTTAWTLGRIFEFLHGSTVETPIITNENCQLILTVLLQSMKDVPNVAEKACGALYFLAQGYEDVSSGSPMSPLFQEIIQALLNVTHREDARESRLRTAAYETLNEVVRTSTDETAPIVTQLLPVIMMELHQTLEAQKLSSDEREKQNELQGLLCGCLQVIIQKLGASEATKDDAVMKTAVGVLGDLADTLGSHAGTLINQSVASKEFLEECLSSDDQLIKESADWAKLAISRAISG
ncbi:hypothetical protein C4D60_Mb01t33050 [Musa balbisiana]|uniref:Importin N-terminal domain-containing protein n=1 Tax=Musa balbisiana TaxID=52838 RepID=A0A4S8JSH7_MUSBA|nr:hypothetical protein C4D60_Mb01t33050 [Musa balbisiana]